MGNKSRVAKTATEGVRLLWEDKFFRGWKEMGAVAEALAKRENHFPRAALDMALKRASHLTRRGTQGSYEYIQRYPYVPEDCDAPAPKKGGKK